MRSLRTSSIGAKKKNKLKNQLDKEMANSINMNRPKAVLVDTFLHNQKYMKQMKSEIQKNARAPNSNAQTSIQRGQYGRIPGQRGNAVKVIEADIDSRIKDLEHRYRTHSGNQRVPQPVELNDLDCHGRKVYADGTQVEEAEHIVTLGNQNQYNPPIMMLDEQERSYIASEHVDYTQQATDNSQDTMTNDIDQTTGRVAEQDIQDVSFVDQPNIDYVYQTSNQSQPRKYEMNTNDQIKLNITNIIDNFEEVLLREHHNEYILKQLVQQDLREQIKDQMKRLQPMEIYQKVDVFKMEDILNRVDTMMASNDSCRQTIQSLGVTVNQMASTSLEMKERPDLFDRQLADMGNAIQNLNNMFNDIHFKILQNDDELGKIKVNCIDSLSSNNYLKKFDFLETNFDQLQDHHTQLKRQMSQQVLENKRLEDDLRHEKDKTMQQQKNTFEFNNLENLLQEKKQETDKLQQQIDDLKISIFQKDREIDKLNHSIKFGVKAGYRSGTFDHSYPGAGGTIASGHLSKVEMAMQQHQNSSSGQAQLQWRKSCEEVVRLALRFLSAMRNLQRSVHNKSKSSNGSEDKMQLQKMEFDSHRKELEKCINQIKQNIEESNLDVILKKNDYDDGSATKSKGRVGESLDKVKNLMKYHQNGYKPVIDEKENCFKTVSSGAQTDLEGGNYSPRKGPVPPISVYKPQELIRLELEHEQLKSEMGTFSNMRTDFETKLQNMTRSLNESNQRQFLSEKENERLQKMNEQLLREKVEIQFKAEQMLKQQTEQTGTDSNQQTQSLNERKRVTFSEDFENESRQVKDQIRSSRFVLDKAERRNESFHQSSPMESLASTVKTKSYAGDPFKKPDEYNKQGEDFLDECEEIQHTMGELLQEKEAFISNLTIQKQRLQDIIGEMEKERVLHLDQIDDLEAQVENWKTNEANLQDLERLKGDHKYLGEELDSKHREINSLKDQLARLEQSTQEVMESRLHTANAEYEKLLLQSQQERAEYLNQCKIAHEAQKEQSVTTENFLKLQREFSDLQRIKFELDGQLTESRQKILENQADKGRLEFLDNKCKQFDQQIIEQQDYISKMQGEFKAIQSQNKQLMEKRFVADQEKEQDLRANSQLYQIEMLKVQDQLQSQIRDLEMQLLSKNEEIEYHKKSISNKVENKDQSLKDQKEELEYHHQIKTMALENQISKLNKQLTLKEEQIHSAKQDVLAAESKKHDNLKTEKEKMSQIESDLHFQLKKQQEEIIRLKTQVNAGNIVPPNNQHFAKIDELQKENQLLNESNLRLDELEKQLRSERKQNEVVVEELVKERNLLRSQLRTESNDKERDARIEQLEDQIQQEKKLRIKAEDELKIAQSNIYQSYQDNTEKLRDMKSQMSADSRQAQIQRLETELQDTQETLKELKKDRDNVINENQNLILQCDNQVNILEANKNLIEDIQKQLDIANDRRNEEVLNCAKAATRLQEVEKQTNELKEQLSKTEFEMKQGVLDRERNIQIKDTELQQKIEQISQLQDSLSQKNLDILKKQQELAEYSQQKEQLEDKLTQQDQTSLQTQYDLTRQKQEMRDKDLEVQKKHLELKNALQDLKRIEDLKKNQDEELAALTAKVSRQLDQIETLADDNVSLRNQAEGLKLLNKELCDQIKKSSEDIKDSSKLEQVVEDLQQKEQKLKQFEMQNKLLEDKIQEAIQEKLAISMKHQVLESQVKKLEEDAFFEKQEESDKDQGMNEDELEQLNQFKEDLDKTISKFNMSKLELQKKFDQHLKNYPNFLQMKDDFVQNYVLDQGASEADIPEDIKKLVLNEQLRCVKIIDIFGSKYFICQREENAIQELQNVQATQSEKEDKGLYLVAEDQLDQKVISFIHSYIPSAAQATETVPDDVIEIMMEYEENITKNLEQMHLIKIDYQIFMNKVMKQDESIDDFDYLSSENLKQKLDSVKQENFLLRQKNLGYQNSVSELKLRVDELNQMIKESIKDGSETSNKNEQQLQVETTLI